MVASGTTADVERLRNGMRLLSGAVSAFAEATSDYGRLLTIVARSAAEVIGDICTVLLLDDAGDLRARALFTTDASVESQLTALIDTPIRAGEPSMAWNVIATGQSVFVPTFDLAAAQSRMAPRNYELFHSLGVHSLMVVPMRVRAAHIGVMAMWRHRKGRAAFDELDLELAQDLANHAALAITNARLVAALRDKDELREAKERAESASKELEAFSYSVAHDLRAPLRGIDGFSQALLDDYGDRLDETGRSYLARVRKLAQRMAELIDDLLALSRVTRSELVCERVDLSALTQAAAVRLTRLEPERSVQIEIASDLVVDADARLLSIVLDNLLGNAWKFTSGVAMARIEIGSEATTTGLRYFVRDNGAGFDPSYAHKLFGVFQRLHTEAEFPGTGIGLATVARIIHRHHGRVWAEGSPGKGATFYFTLGDPEAA